MSSDLITPPTTKAQGSWASRFFRGGDQARPHAGRTRGRRRTDGLQEFTSRLIADDRYAFVLLKDADVDEEDSRDAWEVLHEQMALVPLGVVPVVQSDGTHVPTEVRAFHLDRYAVTNEQYQRFVRAGGYDDLQIWPPEIWPGLMKFIDRTDQPGPREWEHGRYPVGKADHPVVGVSWFEAFAYARWVGKRLPTAAEWQKAGGWPEQLSGGSCNRFPWGDVFEPGRANLWATNIGDTVAVHQFKRGATRNGVHQMAGNVWEWLDDPLESIPSRSDDYFQVWRPMRRIIGGAFDTYVSNEAICQFITGQAELDRRPNIGFRCVVSASKLQSPDGPHSAGDDTE